MKRALFVASAVIGIAVVLTPSVSAAGTMTDPDPEACLGYYTNGTCVGVHDAGDYICVGISTPTICAGMCIETGGRCPLIRAA